MSGRAIVLFAVLAILAALPFLPGLLELVRRADDRPLEIDETFKRDPRYFGLAFREKIGPFLHGPSQRDFPARIEITLRRPEVMWLHEILDVPEETRERSILVALKDATIGRGAWVGEVYAAGNAHALPGARIRALAADRRVMLEEGCRIERWVDAEEGVLAGPDCDLGISVSAGGGVRLSAGCTFRRVWGLPIYVAKVPSHRPTEPPADDPAPPVELDERGEQRGISIETEVMWGRQHLALPEGFVLDRDLVAETDVLIGAGARIRGTIKADGAIRLGEGALVTGNLISRTSVEISARCRILGNVFSEGDVSIGPGTQVAKRGGTSTVYAAGTMLVESGVVVRGRLIAERGGKVDEF